MVAAASAIAFAAPAYAGDRSERDLAYPIIVLSGLDVADRILESYSGFYYALNGDLTKSGFIVRVLGTAGSYDYTLPTGRVDSDYWQGDVMIGHQWVVGRWDFGVYVGADYQSHSLSPDDPFNQLRGSELGVKVLLDLETNQNGTSPIYAALRGNYSTAFDTYLAVGRLGYLFGHLAIGPEAWAFGDVEGDAHRLGGFVKFDLPMLGTTSTELTFSAGYQWNDGNGRRSDGEAGFFGGEDGLYATIKMITAFGTPAPLR